MSFPAAWIIRSLWLVGLRKPRVMRRCSSMMPLTAPVPVDSPSVPDRQDPAPVTPHDLWVPFHRQPQPLLVVGPGDMCDDNSEEPHCTHPPLAARS